MGDFERRVRADEDALNRKRQQQIDAHRAELLRNKRCMTCKWWDKSEIAPTSRSPCRVNPPVRMANVNAGLWPFVEDDDWCGSHVTDAVKVDELCLDFARELANG